MARQLALQMACFGQVIEQHQLPRLGIQRAGCNRQAPAIAQRDLVPVVFSRCKTAGNDHAPQLPHQRLAKQLAGGRVGFAHATLGVDDNDPARQQVEQVLQAIGQTFFFGQFGHALITDDRQLTLEFGYPRFKQVEGRAQLTGDLVEQA
ncbi:hypothetical protein D3C77_515260 [compost metagenome]